MNFLKTLNKLVDNFCKLENKLNLSNIYDDLKLSMAKICKTIDECEANGVKRESIISIIEPIKKIFRTSPFLNRMQEWPRGYHGDFETLEYLVSGINKAKVNTFSYQCEKYALESPICEQHRNKIKHQSQLIIDTINNYNEPSILSIASGGSIDIRRSLNFINNRKAKFVINDIDKDAIEFSSTKLLSYPSNCEFNFIPGNVFRLVTRKVKSHDPFDLVVTGGLFDYLPDNAIVYIIQGVLHNLLKPGGKMFFTNIACDNPYNSWLIYLFNWALIERNEDHIQKLINDAGSKTNFSSRVWRDETGITCLAEITKKN